MSSESCLKDIIPTITSLLSAFGTPCMLLLCYCLRYKPLPCTTLPMIYNLWFRIDDETDWFTHNATQTHGCTTLVFSKEPPWFDWKEKIDSRFLWL